MLRQVREECGVSQRELGRRLGMSQPILSAIESGDRRLDLLEFMDIMQAIGYDPVEFIGRLKSELSSSGD